MKKYLLLTNLVDNYTFVKTKVFMTSQISSLFRSYALHSGKEITEVLFVTYAFNGLDKDEYVANVRNLFGAVKVKLITDGDPATLIEGAQALVIGGGSMTKLENGVNAALRTAINNKITNSGIPYIGWNEGSVFACPTKIEDLSSLTSGLISAVPFQIVCHYNYILYVVHRSSKSRDSGGIYGFKSA